MKLYCLGLDPSSSCFLLKIHHVCVLLDCGLELASLLTFLPDGLKDSLNSEEFKKSLPSLNFKQIGANTYINSAPKFHLPQLSLIDISSVDAIVITNFYNILALPYITEYTGFKGKIYATEPTIQMGSLLMHELVNFHQSYINQQDTSIWQTKDSFKVLDPVHREKLLYSSHWRPLYTSHNIDIAISKVSPVNFLQEINIFDLVTVIPVSSGYCLGGANLVIKTHYDKIVYMAHTSGISRHPEPFDATLMKLPHTLILTQLQSPTVQPKSLENSFVEFSGAIQHTLAMGGSVIVPVYSCGVILDLFEYVDNFLGSASLRHATQYYVSPVSETVLAYADIVPEWLYFC
jgi:integrator complex subunit 9